MWPAVSADHLMDSAETLQAYHAAGPWRVRVAGRGNASLLGAWRLHLDVLAMRGVWCAERHVATFVDDAAVVGREHGFAQLFSPLLPTRLLGTYQRSGMRTMPPIVAIQGVPSRIRRSEPHAGVSLRPADESDVAAMAELDALCFEELWRYAAEELDELLRHERCMVAETVDGQLIGYTLATVSRGAGMLSRLCVSPEARRGKVGSALLSEVGRWATDAGASTVALCTEEANTAARALYLSAGLIELDERYTMAVRDI